MAIFEDARYGNHKENMKYFKDKPDILEFYIKVRKEKMLKLLPGDEDSITPEELEAVLRHMFKVMNQ